MWLSLWLQTTQPDISPTLTYIIGFGVTPVAVVLLAVSGRIDLNAKARDKREAEYKEMNMALVAALDKRGDEYESLITALRTIATVRKD